MKNTVNFETAIALKEAGFPQPEPKFGQFWYDAGAGIWVVGESGPLVMRSLSSRAEMALEDVDENAAVFAPTAIEILEQLPELYAIYRWDTIGGWCIDIGEPREATGTPFSAKDAPQAAAKAYLELKKANK